MKEFPERIADFDVNAFLAALKGNGYSLFLVRAEVGQLPGPAGVQTKNNLQFYLREREIEGRRHFLLLLLAGRLHRKVSRFGLGYEWVEDLLGCSEMTLRATRGSGGEDSSFVEKGAVRGQPTEHVWPSAGG